jgi:diguanylate cyclase (GGDEF)-like protein
MSLALAQEQQQNKPIIFYGLILLFIAIISFVIYLTLKRELAEQKVSAYIINLSGRQRMLSQFIAVNALEYKKYSSVDKAKILKKSIAEMREAHHFLINLPHISTELQSLYYEPINTHIRLNSYLALAESIVTKNNNDEDLKTLLKRRHTLLASLEKIVDLHQKESQQKTITQQRLQLSMLALIFGLLLLEAHFIIFPTFKKLRFYFHLAIQDTLTGSHNRRYFLQLLKQEHNRCLRYGGTYSLCIIDIDYFKRVNDRYGHPVGDKVIQRIAHTIEKEIRANDQCGRIGGEEFAVLFVGAGEEEAYRISEKLRMKIDNIGRHLEETTLNITVSIGVASYSQSAEKPETTVAMDDIIKHADMALYTAKQAGRNQTHLWKKSYADTIETSDLPGN